MRTPTSTRLAGGLPNRETLRIAACALSPGEWKLWMRDVLFEIDTGVRDGNADNQRLWEEHSLTEEGAR